MSAVAELGGVALRRLRAGEGRLFTEHLLRLDDESRRRRFGRVVSDRVVAAFGAGEADRPGVVIGAFVAGVLRGVAELRPAGREGLAEAAFSVESAFQRRGIGSRLFQRAMLVARNRGVREVTVLCLSENRAMQRLARRHGGALVSCPGEVVGTMPERAPTLLSLWAEAVDEAAGSAAVALGWWLRNNPFAPAPITPAART